MNLGNLRITFCGHGTFAMATPGGNNIIVDPWFEQNPACPPRLKKPDKAEAILLTHAHFDHVADAVTTAKRLNATCVAIHELSVWLAKKGVEKTVGMNKGGTVDVAGVKATMTHAVHSSGLADGDEILYGGDAAGYVLTYENGIKVYHAGDTCVFGDMKIIGEIYRPDLVVLPIGGHYTMDPVEAAYAVRLLGAKTVVPAHYGTFPILTGTPERLRELTADITGLQIVALKPGESLTGELQIVAG